MTDRRAEEPSPGQPVLVVGTAGHVDHGKSALVRALTGTDPDRLAEEKARGLTIDLGFAWMRLQDGSLISFVDVPGHEDFVHNMLAGAGGVLAFLLVVAADEGPMPQTREHLAILDLLGVTHGVVALTKCDLVDPDWLALVREETTQLLQGTGLERAPIVPVSAVRGDGLDDLVRELGELVRRVPRPVDRGRPRLAADRVFKLAGFGTIVTGTLRDGKLLAGEAVQVQPGGLRSRARSVQSYGRNVDAAQPGSRVAVNLTGVSTAELTRGDVVCLPNSYRPTRLLDVSLRVLADAGAAVRHDDSAMVYCAASEVPAQARVIGQAEIRPAAAGFAQLRLARPIVACAGDRFVVRRASPPRTVGGGRVLDPHPRSRWRRYRASTAERFRALASDSPLLVAWAALSQGQPCAPDDLVPCDTGLEPPDLAQALGRLADDQQALDLGGLWMTRSAWDGLSGRAKKALDDYHRANPLRSGMPAEQLRERLGLSPEAFAVVAGRAQVEGWLARSGATVRAAGHGVKLDAGQKAGAERLLDRYRASPFRPPSAKEAEAAVGADVLASLVEGGDLVSVGGDVLFDRQAYDALRDGVLRQLALTGRVTVADVRDQFGTSRKYALALLEHLDRLRVTRRQGDDHVLWAGAREARQ